MVLTIFLPETPPRAHCRLYGSAVNLAGMGMAGNAEPSAVPNKLGRDKQRTLHKNAFITSRFGWVVWFICRTDVLKLPTLLLNTTECLYTAGICTRRSRKARVKTNVVPFSASRTGSTPDALASACGSGTWLFLPTLLSASKGRRGFVLNSSSSPPRLTAAFD